MSTEIKYQLNILFNSLNLVKMYGQRIRYMHTKLENRFYINSYCNECDTILCINPNFFSKYYLNYCKNNCTCETQYCQIEHMYNREGYEHDEILNTREKLKYQMDIKNNTLKILHNILSNREEQKYFNYCKKCFNICDVVNKM